MGSGVMIGARQQQIGWLLLNRKEHKETATVRQGRFISGLGKGAGELGFPTSIK